MNILRFLSMIRFVKLFYNGVDNFTIFWLHLYLGMLSRVKTFEFDYLDFQFKILDFEFQDLAYADC